MSEEVDLAAKTTGAVVKALAEESGALQPVQEFAEYLQTRIHYRYYPKLVNRALAAAEKIQQSGLPRRAFSEVPDPLLRAILENGAMEDEPSMQERWENLLANAVTSGSSEVRKAFPNVLSELEPAEAAQLDKFAHETTSETLHATTFSIYGGFEGFDNLVRLGLLDYVRTLPQRPAPGTISDDRSTITGVMFTSLGWEFVQACRAPQPALTTLPTGQPDGNLSHRGA